MNGGKCGGWCGTEGGGGCGIMVVVVVVVDCKIGCLERGGSKGGDENLGRGTHSHSPIHQQKADIVVTVNVPFSSPYLVRGEGSVAAPGYEGGLSGTPGELMSAGLAVRDKVLASLKIVDWGLFVHEE
jgi:hypothetical protein